MKFKINDIVTCIEDGIVHTGDIQPLGLVKGQEYVVIHASNYGNFIGVNGIDIEFRSTRFVLGRLSKIEKIILGVE